MRPHTEPLSTPPPIAAPGPWGHPAFRWLTAASVVSLLGDQFSLLAMPWLALRVSADPVVLGAVLALTGAPRALLILLGGALADRHDPRRLLLHSRLACGGLLVLLVLLLLWRGTAGLGVPLLLGAALALGVASAFGIPAASALLPRVLPPTQLQPANGLLMALRQLAMALGPLAAGTLVALGDGGAAMAVPAHGGLPGSVAAGAVMTGPVTTGSMVPGSGMPGAAAADAGLIAALALDGLSFWLSAAMLTRVRSRPGAAVPPGSPAPARAAAPVGSAAPAVAPSALSAPRAVPGRPGLLGGLWQGLQQLAQDRPLRLFMAYFALGAVLAQGPAQVAMPLLAASRPDWGARGYGALMAAHGLGALLGMLALARRPAGGPVPRQVPSPVPGQTGQGGQDGQGGPGGPGDQAAQGLGRRLLLTDAAIGLLVLLMGLCHTLGQALALMAATGLLGGGLQVRVFSWVQQRVPPALLGRAMGLFMAVFMGLVPLSSALTSTLLRWASPTQVFVGAGAALMLLAAAAAVATPLGRLGGAAR